MEEGEGGREGGRGKEGRKRERGGRGEVNLSSYMCILNSCSSFSADGTNLFETLNLNSQASWYTEQPEGKALHVLCLQQLEKDTIFIGMDRILQPGIVCV